MVIVRRFAELKDNVVLRVLVVAENECLDSNGNFQELLGESLCRRLSNSPNKWIECSDDGSLRKQPCSPSMAYDETRDGFYNTNKPFGTWKLDDDLQWQPPVSRPTPVEGFWFDWDEDNLSWVKKEDIPRTM